MELYFPLRVEKGNPVWLKSIEIGNKAGRLRELKDKWYKSVKELFKSTGNGRVGGSNPVR
jgi:hypothetical protein